MKVAVTGTPGAGKTTVARRLAEELGYEYFDATERVNEGASAGYDKDRGVPVADIEALREEVPKDTVIDGHISHRLSPDYVVVLRCAPDVLRRRLEERGWPKKKTDENVNSEALDVVLAEALESDAPVFEYNTTDATPDETVRRLLQAIEDREERHGIVDWSAHIGGKV